jgi:hypothetical protein
MISSKELIKLLTDSGIRPDVINVQDENFVLPTPEWITNDLSKALNDFFFYSGIKYEENQYDCNRFAKTASTIADWCWAKTKTEDAALALGMFGYFYGINGHVITIAVHRDEQGKLYLGFYEPQPSAEEGKVSEIILCLTKRTLYLEDIQSCISCLFL